MPELSENSGYKSLCRKLCFTEVVSEKVRAITVGTIGMLLIPVFPATAQDDLEKHFIESAKNIPVHQLDPVLPPQPLAVWLDSVAESPSEVIWEVNDCGEQTGSPADKGQDFPACVEAIVDVTQEVKLHISIIVGTFNRGVTGRTKLFQIFVDRNGKYQRVEKLSDISEMAGIRGK